MAVSVQRLQYFYTEVPDKPGEGSKLLSLLHEKGVKLLAFSWFPQGRRASWILCRSIRKSSGPLPRRPR